MKVAEALAERGDLQRRLAALQSRIRDSALYQEGENPPEDVNDLLGEADEVTGRLTELISRVNLTNAVTELGDESLTTALARRDVLRLRIKFYQETADAGAGSRDRYYRRATRSELADKTDLNVPALRTKADALSAELRQLDLKIQALNWDTDLI